MRFGKRVKALKRRALAVAERADAVVMLELPGNPVRIQREGVGVASPAANPKLTIVALPPGR